jgi:hypothetical protein
MGLVAAGAPPELATKPPQEQPLTFLLSAMNDATLPITTRIDAAKAAAPYVHFRKGLVDTTGRDVPLTVQIIRFSDLAGELETPERRTIDARSAATLRAIEVALSGDAVDRLWAEPPPDGVSSLDDVRQRMLLGKPWISIPLHMLSQMRCADRSAHPPGNDR